MSCEHCRFWHFPTKALYQKLYTKGYCAAKLPVKMTYPNHTCDKCEQVAKPEQLHKAVSDAIPQVKRERFGAIMNIDDEIKQHQDKINELKRGNQRNHGGISMPDLMKKVDAVVDNMPVKPITPLQPNDTVTVRYRQPLKILAMTTHNQTGNVKDYICAKTDGNLVVVNSTDCDIVKC